MADQSTWTAEQLNPDPPAWPQCTTCDTPYVLRRCISLSKGYMWAWMKDCEKPRSTCKNAVAAIYTADGLLTPADEVDATNG